MHAATFIRVEWTAVLLGVALAGLAVAGWQVDGGLTTPPAEVAFATAPSDTLSVSPSGQTVKATLRASDPDGGLVDRLTVRNATGDAQAVRVKAEPSTSDLDRALMVRVAAKGQPIWEGTVGQLRAGTTEAFVLQSHETADVTLTAWIPETIDNAVWRARVAAVQVSFVTEGTA